MRSDPFLQLRLLELQGLDTKLGQLAHRRSTLPLLAELAEIMADAAKLRDREVGVRTAASDLNRELTKAENDVSVVRERIARDQQLLDGGTISAAKQLTELQHEVTSLKTRVRDLEDVELAVMERLEEANIRAGEIETARVELEIRKAAMETSREEAFAAIDAEVALAASERGTVLADLPSELLALYDRIRGDSGTGAAALYRGRCQGCQLTLTPGDLARIRAEAPDSVVRCEECRRILVRTAESGL